MDTVKSQSCTIPLITRHKNSLISKVWRNWKLKLMKLWFQKLWKMNF